MILCSCLFCSPIPHPQLHAHRLSGLPFIKLLHRLNPSDERRSFIVGGEGKTRFGGKGAALSGFLIPAPTNIMLFQERFAMAAIGPTYLTPEGKRQLEEELEYLRTVKRREIAERLRFAIQQGDLSENADYHAAKEEQAFIEGRIRALEAILNNAIVIEPQSSEDGRVRLGSRVTIAEDGGSPETYILVGPAEADPTRGKISYESPLGQALLGRMPGDTVTVEAPAGTLTFRILAVE